MYNHSAIPVLNLVESQNFYEVLGFTKLQEWAKPDQELSAIVMQKEGYILELVHHPTNTPNVPNAVVEVKHVGVSVTNLPELLEQLQQKGVKILKPLTQGVSVKEFAFIEDPNGWPVELVVEK